MGFNQGHATFGTSAQAGGGGGTGTTSGIQSLNLATGPDVTIKAGSGVDSIVRVANNIYINTSGVAAGLNSINGSTGPAISLREQLGSGIEILTSGTSIFFGLKPIDLTSSGFATQSQITTSGYLKASDRMYPVDARAVSGHIFIDVSGKWNIGTDTSRLNNLFANSGIFQSGVSVSGFPLIYRIDTLAGPVIYFSAGPGITKTVSDHTITFAADLTSSGFATQSQITTSGYLLASDRLYPVDARALSGSIVPTTSGAWNLGSPTKFLHQIWANSGIYQSGVSVSGFDIIYKVNGLNGPFVNFGAGAGVTSFVNQDHTIFLNVAPSGSDGYKYATIADIANSGFATRSELTTSGYLKASDRMYPVDARAVSGNIVPDNSGFWNLGSSTKFFHQIWANSGIYQSGVSVSGKDVIFRFNNVGGPSIDLLPGYNVISIQQVDHKFYINVSGIDLTGSGFATQTQITTSGYLLASDRMYPVDARQVSGHIITNASGRWDLGTDTLRFNNLWANSGVYQSGVSVSGLPIIYKINGLGGPVVTLKPGYNVISIVTQDHDIYINVSGIDLTGSGFVTQTQITTSGYLLASDRLYPVDARAVSGNIVPNNSGFWNLGSSTKFFHQFWANSGIYQSGVSVSGSDIIYKVNGLSGPFVNIKAGTGVASIVLVDHDIYINTSGSAAGGSGITSLNSATGPDVVIKAGSGVDSIVRDNNNIYINTSGIDQICAENIIWQYSVPTGDLLSGIAPEGICFASGIQAGSGIEFVIVGPTIIINASGFVNQVAFDGSGYLLARDRLYPVDARAVSGNIIPDNSGYWNLGSSTKFFHQLWANSGIFQSGVSVSGVELINKINGLGGPFLTLVGSGSTAVWVDGRTIQIGSTGGGGPQSYYPVDARAVSGHIIPDVSGKWDLGSDALRFKNIWANSGIFQSGVSVSGFPVIYQIDSLSGPVVRFSAGPGISKTTSDHTITFAADLTSSGFATQSQITTSGYLLASDRMYPVDARAVSGNIVPNNSGYWNLGSASKFFNVLYANSGIFQSGIAFGDASANYPALRFNGTDLESKLGDNSAYARIVAKKLKTNDLGVEATPAVQIGADDAGWSNGYQGLYGSYGGQHVIKIGNQLVGVAVRKDSIISWCIANGDLQNNASDIGIGKIYTSGVQICDATSGNFRDIYLRCLTGQSGLFASGVWVSGIQTIYQVNGLGGPFVNIKAGSGVSSIDLVGHDIYINASGFTGSGIASLNSQTGPNITIGAGYGIASIDASANVIRPNTSGFLTESGVSRTRRHLFIYDATSAYAVLNNRGHRDLVTVGTLISEQTANSRLSNLYRSNSAGIAGGFRDLSTSGVKPNWYPDAQFDFRIATSGTTTQYYWGFTDTDPQTSGLGSITGAENCAFLSYRVGDINFKFFTKDASVASGLTTTIPTSIADPLAQNWHDVRIWTPDKTKWFCAIDDKIAAAESGSDVPSSGTNLGFIWQEQGNGLSDLWNSYVNVRVNTPNRPTVL